MFQILFQVLIVAWKGSLLVRNQVVYWKQFLLMHCFGLRSDYLGGEKKKKSSWKSFLSALLLDQALPQNCNIINAKGKKSTVITSQTVYNRFKNAKHFSLFEEGGKSALPKFW